VDGWLSSFWKRHFVLVGLPCLAVCASFIKVRRADEEVGMGLGRHTFPRL